MKYVSSFLLLMVVLLVLPIDAVDFSGKWEIVQAKESRAKLIKTGSIITLSGDVIIRHDADEYRADTVIIYEKEEIVVLHGSVKVLRRDASVTADNCEYRSAQDAAIFTGNVIITQKNATITGTRALIRTETADIEVTGDVYFSQENYSGIADYFYYNDTL